MVNYNFRDLAVATDEELEQQITEGFSFGDYDSTQEGLFLVSREAPTPDEKEMVESVPFMQGQYDFSTLNTDRFFENREITYKLIRFESEYEDRKEPEQKIKRQLMPLGVGILYDTHDRGYHWRGKCKSVEVEDDSETNLLTATVVFDCYPFAIKNDAVTKEFDVTDGDSVLVSNDGVTTVTPKIVTDSTFTINPSDDSSEKTTLKSGNYDDPDFVLRPGQNWVDVAGSGKLSFEFHPEVML